MKNILISSLVIIALLASFVFAGTIGITSEKVDDKYITAVLVNKGWNLIPVSSGGSGSLHAVEGIEEFRGGPVETDKILSMSDYKYVWIYDIDADKYVGGSYESYQTNPEMKAFSEKMNNDPSYNTYYSYSSAWFYFDKQGMLFFERQIDGSPALDNMYLIKGWNFIHTVPEMDGMSFDEFKGDCEIEKIAGWMVDEQNWQVDDYADMYQGELHDDSIGVSLLIKVVDDCSFSGMGGGSSPPSVPGMP